MADRLSETHIEGSSITKSALPLLEGEIAEEKSVRTPYELDGEKKLALIGLDANQMVLVSHGLHLLVNALKKEEAFTGGSHSQPVEAFFHDMASIAEEVRAL